MGFIEPLKGIILIPCTKHVQDDIKQKLSSIGITGDHLKHEIMCDIFGNDKALEKGLIDARVLMYLMIN